MENLFYQRKISRRFDLKGSDRNRWVHTDDPTNVVLLDENLLQSLRQSPFYIRPECKQRLTTAIDNDSTFLSSHSVMDYSLLVGIDQDQKRLVVGVIDYIRPYTWDKRIEMVVKSVGSHGKMPTIVSPDLYRERFREKMNQYFLCIPDG
jgi:1-phosphatidylinositol-3-phosphate 5-kinase